MSKVAKLAKIALGLTSVSGLGVGTAALLTDSSVEKQSDQPAPILEEPKSIKDLDDRIKKLEEGGNSDGSLTKELKSIKDKQDKQKTTFEKEKEEVMSLFDKVKQFANYGDISGFIDKMREIVTSYNSLSERLDKAEDDYKKAEGIGLQAYNYSREAFCAVKEDKCKTIDGS